MPSFAHEPTPVAVGGTLYTSTSLAQVAAIDGVTGKSKWVFNPEVYKAGRPEDGTDPKLISMAEILVDLKPPAEWKRRVSKADIMREMVKEGDAVMAGGEQHHDRLDGEMVNGLASEQGTYALK